MTSEREPNQATVPTTEKNSDKNTQSSFDITIELSGGLELLFENQKKHTVHIEGRTTMPMRELLAYVRDEMLSERPELFMQDDSVRPGVLVLVNECDWELENGIEYEVQSGDALVFISTLHGG